MDRRTKVFRRAKSLAAAYTHELGGKLSEAKQAAVQRAAELTAIAEDSRARRMAGDDTIDLNDLVRLDSSARRAIKDLQLPAPDQKPVESFENYWIRVKRNDDGDTP